MSRAELEQAACGGKHPFPTKLAALKVARRMQGNDKGGTDVFRCPYCGKFHIGHADRKVSKVARRRFEQEFAER